jgi:hypothetical protein
MGQLVGGPWVVGRVRALLLLGVAVAAVVDLLTFGVLVVPGDTAAGPAQAPGPDEVARAVVQAVADDDCADLDALLADAAVLPSPVTDCLAGTASPVAITGVSVEDTRTGAASSTVTVGLDVAGQPAQVLVDLRRDDGAWRVTAIRPAAD